jgi:hypothetical protein
VYDLAPYFFPISPIFVEFFLQLFYECVAGTVQKGLRLYLKQISQYLEKKKSKNHRVLYLKPCTFEFFEKQGGSSNFVFIEGTETLGLDTVYYKALLSEVTIFAFSQFFYRDDLDSFWNILFASYSG